MGRLSRTQTVKIVVELDTDPIVKQIRELADALDEVVSALHDTAHRFEKTGPEALAEKVLR